MNFTKTMSPHIKKQFEDTLIHLRKSGLNPAVIELIDVMCKTIYLDGMGRMADITLKYMETKDPAKMKELLKIMLDLKHE